MRDAWRLALGTLTAVPVTPPTEVTPKVAGRAMLLAPFAVVPLGVLVGLVVWAGKELALPQLGTGLVAVGVLALGSRAFHLDGLSDVADGLTSSYDRERSLAVMKSGSSGPAGTVALVVVLGVQAVGFGALVFLPYGAVLAGALVCLSRAALLLTCARGVPGARPDGLGSSFVGSVPAAAALLGWVLVIVATAGLVAWSGDGWIKGGVTALVALVVVLVLIQRAVHRFGGVTGDVYGAAIEVTLAVLVLGASGGGFGWLAYTP
ncbi:MAG: adenosylcobinamide-GDP ribazoletransferase [Nocardioidaceae bacterium]|nr:adenosylcobinamide-GDP ribazoletransferase [Nocardioidaceae bacterium]